MGALRGVVAGGLGLTAMYALISTQQAANNAGTLVTLGAGAVRRLVDPNVPLIPDRTGTTTHKKIILAN